MPQFTGSDYIPSLDQKRLTGQLKRIYNVMIDGEYRSLREIATLAEAPEASVSANLRNLRKEQFGSYTVNKRRRGEPKNGLFEYQLLKRVVAERQESFSFS